MMELLFKCLCFGLLMFPVECIVPAIGADAAGSEFIKRDAQIQQFAVVADNQ